MLRNLANGNSSWPTDAADAICRHMSPCVAWRHKAITWSNVDLSNVFRGIHLKIILRYSHEFHPQHVLGDYIFKITPSPRDQWVNTSTMLEWKIAGSRPMTAFPASAILTAVMGLTWACHSNMTHGASWNGYRQGGEVRRGNGSEATCDEDMGDE